MYPAVCMKETRRDLTWPRAIVGRGWRLDSARKSSIRRGLAPAFGASEPLWFHICKPCGHAPTARDSRPVLPGPMTN